MSTPAQDLRRARGLLALAADDPDLRSNESRSAATKLLRLVREQGYTLAPRYGRVALCGLVGLEDMPCVRPEGHPSHHSAFSVRTNALLAWTFYEEERQVAASGLPPNLADAVASAAGTFVGDVIRSSVGARRRRRT